ncbi:hypothetical protein [Nonomuraea turcica]|uniref:hypothetical protein n=1 Tax=Nonomuraea sp. G32 TaxID=3067274 RepID=UPI00273A9F32|nr:hypothetical protein [Nonomuraea sp. G32]MDP4503220.1 hypothetical protein [Nonomuraea sp. G32]
MQTTHEMVYTRAIDPETNEWSCPSCGRRLLIRWPPHFERLVLEPGDDTAIHTGTQGDITIDLLSAAPAPEITPDAEARDQHWLRDNGIDWDATG